MFREALPVVVVASSVCVSDWAIKVFGADGYLAHARAPDSRTDASRFFCVLRFLSASFLKRKIEKKENLKARRNFNFPPPRLWLKCLASAFGSTGDALCSWGPRPARRLPPPRPDRGALGALGEKRKAGPDGRPHCATARLRARVPACSARLHTSRVCAPRVIACSARLHALRACAPARLRIRRAPARLTGASCGVQPAPSGATRRLQERAI